MPQLPVIEPHCFVNVVTCWPVRLPPFWFLDGSDCAVIVCRHVHRTTRNWKRMILWMKHKSTHVAQGAETSLWHSGDRDGCTLHSAVLMIVKGHCGSVLTLLKSRHMSDVRSCDLVCALWLQSYFKLQAVYIPVSLLSSINYLLPTRPPPFIFDHWHEIST